ncbi:hypothetical protein ACHAXR_001689 [Thalassiosira sp. AJA248-18]
MNPLNIARAREESCFWEIFIPGALAYLTVNLNTNKKIANGVPVRYHSVSFNDKMDQLILEEMLQNTEPGKTITLLKPPDIVNVELFPDFEGDDEHTRTKNQQNRNSWKNGSITADGTIVIPIELSNKKFVKWKTAKIRGRGGSSIFRPSTVQLADHFPIEPGFSVTIHKAQGRTIRRVVLSISEHPERFNRIKWEGLYVALSRVKLRDHIRLLLRGGDRSTMDYISQLKKNNYTHCFFQGYKAENGNSGQYQPMYWDPLQASDAAGFLQN